MDKDTVSIKYEHKIITIIKENIKYLPNWDRFNALVSMGYNEICLQEEGIRIHTSAEIIDNKLQVTGRYTMPFDLRWHTINCQIDLIKEQL